VGCDDRRNFPADVLPAVYKKVKVGESLIDGKGALVHP